MPVYVTDTHPLVWYASRTHRRLSHHVLQTFEAAWRGEMLIYVPVFVLWEIAMLLKVRRLRLREPYDEWATRLVTHRGFALAAVDIAMLTTAYMYAFPDPFDSVIAATAHVLDVPLITNDTAIHAAQVVDVYWSSEVRERKAQINVNGVRSITRGSNEFV